MISPESISVGKVNSRKPLISFCYSFLSESLPIIQKTWVGLVGFRIKSWKQGKQQLQYTSTDANNKNNNINDTTITQTRTARTASSLVGVKRRWSFQTNLMFEISWKNWWKMSIWFGHYLYNCIVTNYSYCLHIYIYIHIHISLVFLKHN